MTRTLEARIERLEAAQSNVVETQHPPRNGLVVASDYFDEDSRAAAVAAEWQRPGIIGVTLIEFVEGEDGRPMQR